MTKWKYLKALAGYIGIAAGAIINAFSIQAFIVHAGLGGGGVGGIALLLFYTLSFPIGLTTLILNVPLFIFGWKEVNRKFIYKTLFGLIVFTIFLDLFKGINYLQFEDVFLGALYGGVLGGIGGGIVFRLGGSLGGTDIVAKVFQRKFGIPMGTSTLGINFIIILTSWAILGPKIALYTLVSMFAYSRTVDVVQSGVPSKAVTIITSNSDPMISRILKEIGRGVTFLDGYGGYSTENKKIIICVVSLPEIGQLKRIVRDIDPNSFMIIQNANEVIGRGFAIE